jgi:hypothetical protein
MFKIAFCNAPHPIPPIVEYPSSHCVGRGNIDQEWIVSTNTTKDYCASPSPRFDCVETSLSPLRGEREWEYL